MIPRVSVCVPAYQAAAHLQEVLDSVYAQDFGDYELVVVDDGSTDATPEILAAQTDPRLRSFRRDRNLGQAATVAEAVARARGGLVKFLDADDLLRRDCLATMASAMEAHPRAILAFARREFLIADPEDPEIQDWITQNGEPHRRFDELAEVNDGLRLLRQYLGALLPGNWIAEPAGVMVRREDLLAVGGYNGRVRQNNDMDLWARLMGRGEMIFIDRPLYDYRLEFNGVTGAQAVEKRQWLDSLWIAEGLSRVDGFPLAAEVRRARRALLRKALRRTAMTPFREPRRTRRRLADLTAYGG
ncbi:MAG TPA: glycosyltransferase family A protein, partial [Solirubrobacterales bacterium]|nr:glycosyltransferase family A protein [Solirubrobacterales bacterium]